MNAICIANTIKSLTSELDKKAFSENIFQNEVCLEIGKEYKIFGICFRDGISIPWYLVCEEHDSDYPKPHLASFFKISKTAIPSGWEFCPTSNNLGDCGFFPKEWARDPSFMEKLIDEDVSAVDYFKKLKSQP